MRRNPLSCFVILLILAAVPLLAGGYFFTFKMYDGMVETQAVVERVDREHGQTEDEGVTVYPVYVRYSVDGQSYSSIALYTNMKKYSPGKTLKIYYDPANPESIKMKDTAFGLPLLIGGSVDLLFAFLLIGVSRRAARRQRYADY